MATQVTKYDHLAVLTSRDDLTRDSIEAFVAAAQNCMNEGANNMVIDFSQVSAIDSAGLEALLDMQDRCEDALGCVKLCALDETVEKILQLTRLIRRFETFADLDSAVRSFS